MLSGNNEVLTIMFSIERVRVRCCVEGLEQGTSTPPQVGWAMQAESPGANPECFILNRAATLTGFGERE